MRSMMSVVVIIIVKCKCQRQIEELSSVMVPLTKPINKDKIQLQIYLIPNCTHLLQHSEKYNIHSKIEKNDTRNIKNTKYDHGKF
jgi:hypothetical protein